VQIFGRGVHYAFSGKTYAAQLDDGGSGLTHKLFEANPLDALKLLVYMNELFEWGLLRGPGGQLPDTRNLDGLRAMDDDRLALEREFASALQDNAKLRRARRQHVLLRELYHELGPEFVKVLSRANLSIESFMWRGIDWVNNFLEDLPIIAVQSALRDKNHANASRPWKPSDLRDFEQLSTAVPYCDIVVTEKHSATILREKGLDTRYNTVILTSITELPDAIERLQAGGREF